MQLSETQRALIIGAGGTQDDIRAAESGEAEFDFEALAAS